MCNLPLVQYLLNNFIIQCHFYSQDFLFEPLGKEKKFQHFFVSYFLGEAIQNHIKLGAFFVDSMFI